MSGNSETAHDLADAARERLTTDSGAGRDHHHDDAHHHHDDHHLHDDDDHDHHGHDHSHAFGWMEALRIVFVAICAAGVYFQWPDANPPLLIIGDQIFLPFSWYALFGIVIGGWPLLVEAYESVLRRRMTMELSMGIAILAAAYTGYFFVALVITFFVLVAEVLEGMTVERGRRAIRDLLELLPREVSVRRNGTISDISSDQLRRGDAIMVAPGALIPVDGPIIGGHSYVDESRITGESMPIEKAPGHKVYAGTINQSGALEIRAERIGRDTSYGRILDAVEQAERSRAPVQMLADRLAGYIVYVALAFAAFEYYISGGDVTSTISVIVVAGACGVAAGTPLAILGAIGRSARLGAIVKGGVHLETLGRVDTVVLDKTGTLTFGTPEVINTTPAAGVPVADLLAAAATAELRSEHALGKAVVAHARSLAIGFAEPQGFDYTPGRGISAADNGAKIVVGNSDWLADNGIGMPADSSGGSGVTEIFVAHDGQYLGSIGVADKVRPEAQRAIAALNSLGIHTVLLTGDTPDVAGAVGAQLGIKDVRSRLLPEQKLAHIKDMVAGKSVVAMVGDGVNDTLALAAASVGVAMGSGTEVAREQADIVLLGNDLERFVETLQLARRTRRIIWFNFAGTVIIDALGIALVMTGFVGPVLAVMIHTGSELAFILNSARLLPIGFKGQDRAIAGQRLPASGPSLLSIKNPLRPAHAGDVEK
jgi:heavy metal translocating P-type ATPase